jgi:hypothetical protein
MRSATLLAPPAPAAPANRRVHERTAYQGVLLLQGKGETTWFPVHGQDVSVGGFAFFSDYAMRRGEQVNVTIEELGALSVAATVRHVKPQHGGFIVGVEFDELLPPEFVQRLF